MDHDTIEGRLLAQRRVLQLLLRQNASAPAGRDTVVLLREWCTMQDGQEDPGAVDTTGLGVGLAFAEEIRCILAGVPGAVPEPRDDE